VSQHADTTCSIRDASTDTDKGETTMNQNTTTLPLNREQIRAEVARQVAEYECCDSDALENIADEYGVSVFVVIDAAAL
jgi:hypothetical protein